MQTVPGDEVDQLLQIGRLSRGIAGEHDHRAVERPLAVELGCRFDRMAMTFQPVRRAACSTILVSGLTPQRSLSLTTGPGGTTKGSKVALSMPR